MFVHYTARVATIAPLVTSGEIGGDTLDVLQPSGWSAGGDVDWNSYEPNDTVECRVHMLGIVLDIVRGDNATNGISRYSDHVTVVGILDDRDANLSSMSHATDRIVGMPQELVRVPATDDAPPVWLRIRRVGGEDVYSLVPASDRHEPRPWYQYGGNAATSTDPHWITYMASRNPGPVKIHDRSEG